MLIENGANSVRKVIENGLGPFLSHVTVEKKIDFRNGGKEIWVVRGVITRRDEYAREHHCMTPENGRDFEITSPEQVQQLAEDACVHNWTVGLVSGGPVDKGVYAECYNCHLRYEVPEGEVLEWVRRSSQPIDWLGKDKGW